MSPAAILGILKFASFFVTAVSAIWGMLNKLIEEDSVGRRRLTRAGQAAVMITVFAALIVGGSYKLEDTIRKEDTRLQSERNATNAQIAD